MHHRGGARPAMSLADSILQTASIARWVSVAVTATDHTIFNPSVQRPGARLDYGLADLPCSSPRSACSREAPSGGKTSAGKSAASKHLRISLTPPLSTPLGLGGRGPTSTASSLTLTLF